MTDAAELPLRIEAHALPGARWAAYERVHVGLQRGRGPVGLVPGDAAGAVFELTVRPVTGPDGVPDFRGPFAQGRRGARFVYLTWGELSEGGGFAMFRRIKLWLADIPEDALRRAVDGGGLLTARLGLTAPDGSPRCASVRPPDITWTLVPA